MKHIGFLILALFFTACGDDSSSGGHSYTKSELKAACSTDKAADFDTAYNTHHTVYNQCTGAKNVCVLEFEVNILKDLKTCGAPSSVLVLANDDTLADAS